MTSCVLQSLLWKLMNKQNSCFVQWTQKKRSKRWCSAWVLSLGVHHRAIEQRSLNCGEGVAMREKVRWKIPKNTYLNDFFKPVTLYLFCILKSEFRNILYFSLIKTSDESLSTWALDTRVLNALRFINVRYCTHAFCHDKCRFFFFFQLFMWKKVYPCVSNLTSLTLLYNVS